MTFDTLGLSDSSLASVRRAGFTTPTPIQRAAIPVALSGRDLIGCAQTGTGKTAAFLLPTLERLAATPGATALVLAPTRELADQIADAATALSADRPVRMAVVFGGVGMEGQRRALAARPQLIVATPGRLIDHMQSGAARLDGVSVLILDEADRMLDMGFAPQLRRILAKVPAARQTLLFSATMPSPGDPTWRDVLAVGLRDPARVAVDPPRVAARAEQSLWLVDINAKTPVLLDLLDEEPGSVLVFTRTKHRADRVARQLRAAGVAADAIHGDRSQSQRERALEAFRAGTARVLVATDIAARGIDVEAVAHVVNYDLPADPEDYVHRIGRTARAERAGRATSFVMPDERATLRTIERLLGAALPPLTPRTTARPLPTPQPQGARPASSSPGAPYAPQGRSVASAAPRGRRYH